MESLQNGFATYFQAIPLISMRTESQASSQSCHSIDADAWYKRGLSILKEKRPDCDFRVFISQLTQEWKSDFLLYTNTKILKTGDGVDCWVI